MPTESSSIVYTNKAKCRDCNRCVRQCPVKAIKIEKGQAQVIAERCISCGTCVVECPQKAKTYRKDIEKVQNFITRGEHLVISVAPSFAGYYSEWERSRLPSALRLIGFSHVGETAVGAYHTAALSKKIIEKEPGKSHLLTACPAFVNYIEKYEPSLVKNLVQIDSPMIIHAKLLRKQYKSKSKIVFVGPCIAKKGEALRIENEHLIDAVLTFDELDKLFVWKNVDFAQCEESSFDEVPGAFARNFPLEGGLLQTANLDTNLMSAKILAISGYDEINEIAEVIKNSTDTYIVEPLFCTSGCINGPGIEHKKSRFESKSGVIKYTEKQKSLKDVNQLEIKDFKANYTKDLKIKFKKYSEAQITETLAKFGKLSVNDELNCKACGYNSCRDKAIAVLNGIAEYEMCVPFMRQLAEAKNNVLIDTSPNGIIVLNENLEIESMNQSFKKMFSCSDVILKMKISYLIDPDPFEKIAAGTVNEIKKIIHYPNYNLICHQICYALTIEKKYIGIFVDVTDLQTNQIKLNDIKTETITQAQELIEHQINMAQELARFLGENTAKGEMLMNSLIDAIKKE